MKRRWKQKRYRLASTGRHHMRRAGSSDFNRIASGKDNRGGGIIVKIMIASITWNEAVIENPVWVANVLNVNIASRRNGPITLDEAESKTLALSVEQWHPDIASGSDRTETVCQDEVTKNIAASDDVNVAGECTKSA